MNDKAPACCLRPHHTPCSEDHITKNSEEQTRANPLTEAESLLYLQSSPFTPQVPSSPKAHHIVYTYTHQPLFPLVYCVTLQRNESEQSRTSAHSRQGDTHCPLNWKYQCNLFQQYHVTKHKVSYLLSGGEEGAPVCSNSMSFSFTGKKPSLTASSWAQPAHLRLIENLDHGKSYWGRWMLCELLSSKRELCRQNPHCSFQKWRRGK